MKAMNTSQSWAAITLDRSAALSRLCSATETLSMPTRIFIASASMEFTRLAAMAALSFTNCRRPRMRMCCAWRRQSCVSVQSFLKRRGLGPEADPQQADPLSQKADAMAALLANSVRRKIAVGSYTGRGIVRVGDQIDEDSMDAFESPRCAMVSGFSVHANVHIETRDRMRLGRLIRYCARPAVATERLSELPDGRLLYRLKRPWRDGTSAVIFERQDFMAKLAVLAPAPRAHLTRYHEYSAPRRRGDRWSFLQHVTMPAKSTWTHQLRLNNGRCQLLMLCLWSCYVRPGSPNVWPWWTTRNAGKWWNSCCR